MHLFFKYDIPIGSYNDKGTYISKEHFKIFIANNKSINDIKVYMALNNKDKICIGTVKDINMDGITVNIDNNYNIDYNSYRAHMEYEAVTFRRKSKVTKIDCFRLVNL